MAGSGATVTAGFAVAASSASLANSASTSTWTSSRGIIIVSTAATATAGSPTLTTMTPASTSAAPAIWMGSGVWPRSTQAKVAAAMTSKSDTNDASLAPSDRVAAMPATYDRPAVTTPSVSATTHHGTSTP